MVKISRVIVESYSKRNVLGQRRWYWRIRHQNGKVMADSAEAYNSRQARDQALDTILGSLTTGSFGYKFMDGMPAQIPGQRRPTDKS
jgi:uncharacterized protein YegP (UPF0339 family)